MFKKILAVARKDILVYFSDRKAMMLSLAVPIMIASFFTLVMGGGGDASKGPQKIKTLIVSEDNDPLTAQVIADLAKADAIEMVSSNRDSALAKVKKGEIGVALVFPKNFATQAKAALFAGQPADLEVYFDPTKGTEKAVVQGTLMQVIMEDVSRAAMSGSDALNGLQTAISISPDPKRKAALQDFYQSYKGLIEVGATGPGANGQTGMRQPFHLKESPITAGKDPDSDAAATRAHIVAGMAMQGVLFFAIEAAMSIQREKQTGMWARMKAAPIGATGILLGRGLGSALIALFVLTAVFGFGFLAMGLRIHGSVVGMALVMISSACMTACFGLLVASLGKSEAQSRGMSVLAVLMMSMLGGAWFPTWMMPKAIQSLSMLIPVRWGIDGFDGALWRGSTLAEIMIPVAGLMAFAAIFATAATLRFRKA